MATAVPRPTPGDYPQLQPEKPAKAKMGKITMTEKAEHVCKEACACPHMTKRRMKKSIDRVQSLMKKIEELEPVAKSKVLENFDLLIGKQEGFLDQKIARLQKMVADFSDFKPIEKNSGLDQSIVNLKKMLSKWNPMKKAKEKGPYPQSLASENIREHMRHVGEHPGGRKQAIAIGISQARRGEHEGK